MITGHELQAAALLNGARLETPFYIFESYADIPERWGEIPDAGFAGDWMGYFCGRCVDYVLRLAADRGWPLNDQYGEPIRARLDYGEGEGPDHCERCGVQLDTGFNYVSVDNELDHFDFYGVESAHDVLAIALCLEEYGRPPWDSFCIGCRASRFVVAPDWQLPERPSIENWERDAFRAINWPCSGCSNPLPMEARKARKLHREWTRYNGLMRHVERAETIYHGWLNFDRWEAAERALMRSCNP